MPAGRWRKQLDTAEACWLGDGSDVPSLVESTGRVHLTVRPRTAILLTRAQRE